jgi:hypothetical protein
MGVGNEGLHLSRPRRGRPRRAARRDHCPATFRAQEPTPTSVAGSIGAGQFQPTPPATLGGRSTQRHHGVDGAPTPERTVDPAAISVVPLRFERMPVAGRQQPALEADPRRCRCSPGEDSGLLSGITHTCVPDRRARNPPPRRASFPSSIRPCHILGLLVVRLDARHPSQPDD